MLCSLIVALLPQTTWIVDQMSGPGTHFTNLPPAVAAAQSGDTILVRAGGYSGVTITGKALVIRGAGSSSTFVSPSVVGNVPMSDHLTLAGISFHASVLNTHALDVVGPGRVVILDCNASVSSFSANWIAAALRVDGGAVVHTTRSRFQGGDLVSASSLGFHAGSGAIVQGSSRLAATACTFRGGNVPIAKAMVVYGGLGLEVSNGEATLCASDCLGGFAGYAPAWAQGGSALVVGTGSVRVSGPATLRGGTGSSGSSGYAVQASPGSAVVHSGVTLIPAVIGAAVTSGAVTMSPVTMPRLTVQASALTSGETNALQPLTMTFDSQLPSAPYAFVVGLRPDYASPFGTFVLGSMLIDLTTAALCTGTLDPQGRFSFSIVPASIFSGALGIPFFSQALAFDFAALQYRASNVDERIFSL